MATAFSSDDAEVMRREVAAAAAAAEAEAKSSGRLSEYYELERCLQFVASRPQREKARLHGPSQAPPPSSLAG